LSAISFLALLFDWLMGSNTTGSAAVPRAAAYTSYGSQICSRSAVALFRFEASRFCDLLESIDVGLNDFDELCR
jgi:hypothetical protein